MFEAYTFEYLMKRALSRVSGGVGGVKVYPVWNGGTVKVVFSTRGIMLRR